MKILSFSVETEILSSFYCLNTKRRKNYIRQEMEVKLSTGNFNKLIIILKNDNF